MQKKETVVTDYFYYIIHPNPFDFPSKEAQAQLKPKEEATEKAFIEANGPIFWIKFGDEKAYGERPKSYGPNYWHREIMIGTGIEGYHQIGKEMETYFLGKKREEHPKLKKHEKHPEFYFWEGGGEKLREFCEFLLYGPPAKVKEKEIKVIDDYFPEVKDFEKAVHGFLGLGEGTKGKGKAMAEILAVVSGIAGLLTLTIEVHKASARYILGVQSASRTVRQFLSELNALTRVLLDLSDVVDQLSDSSAFAGKPMSTLEALKASGQCYAELESLLRKLNDRAASTSFTSSIKSLTWPFSEHKTKATMELVRRNLEAFRAALQIDHLIIGNETLNVVQGLDRYQKAPESKSREILDWLSTSNMQCKQDDIYAKHQENTGEWFLKETTFIDWLEKKDSIPVLWCPGRPGSGKSVMTSSGSSDPSSMVVRYLRERSANDDVAIAYFYCDHRDHERQTTSELVAALVKQLACRPSQLPWQVVDLYERLIDESGRPGLKELESVLIALCKKPSKTFLLIDALDEFANRSERRHFFSLLQELKKASVKIFLTSRSNHEDINERLQQAASIEIVASENDVKMYLEQKMEENEAFTKRLTPRLKKAVVDIITERASGMFLMAVLQLERIRTERTVTRVHKALSLIPPGLTATYHDIVERIKKQAEPDNILGLRILQWVSHSRRLLHVHELCHALAIDWEDDRPPTRQLDVDNILDAQSLIDVCAGLVIIEKESQVVRLVHLTAEAFFENTRGTLFPEADAEIARTCLLYLSFTDFSKGCCSTDREFRSRSQRFPLLRYAAKHWGDHLRGKNERQLRDLALGLLNEETSMSSVVQALMAPNDILEGFSQRYPMRTTKLHLVSRFGLAHLLSLLLDQGADVKASNDFQETSLHWAAELGHEQVVGILLKNGAIRDAQTSFKNTPLHLASENGHEGVTHVLIEEGANLDTADRVGWTALQHAARNGHDKVLKQLLAVGADSEAKDWAGRRALHWAAERGHILVVKNLLNHGAEIDCGTNDGWTPLHQAAEDKHEDLVELLVDKGASVNRCTDSGRSLLNFVCLYGSVRLAKLGLDKGADVNAKDRDAYTPLHMAAIANSESLIQILMEAGADVEAKTTHDRMTWHNTPMESFEPEIQQLLKGHDYPEMVMGYRNKTAMLHAAQNGQLAVVQLLQEAGCLTREPMGGDLSLFHWAAATGHERLVELLLRRRRGESIQPLSGKTPLHYAAERGNKTAVRQLLECGADINAVDHWGRTALCIAIEAGHKATVQLLREEHGEEPDLAS
ncbi:MAG: hypothetical protein Q9214_000321 [Letrouitia sp. 1 TL-2023]